MTRGEIKTAIQALGYGTDTDTAQNQAIDAIDRRIQGMRRWPWNELTTTTTLTTGSSTLPYPTDAREIDFVQIQTSSLDTPIIEFVEWNYLNELRHQDQLAGIPRYWSVRGPTIYFWPVSERDYTVTIGYARERQPLSADGSIPVTDEDYHDLYVYGAARTLAARERDWSMYQTMEQEFQMRLTEMIRAKHIRQRQNSRSVVRSHFWRSINSYG